MDLDVLRQAGPCEIGSHSPRPAPSHPHTLAPSPCLGCPSERPGTQRGLGTGEENSDGRSRRDGRPSPRWADAAVWKEGGPAAPRQDAGGDVSATTGAEGGKVAEGIAAISSATLAGSGDDLERSFSRSSFNPGKQVPWQRHSERGASHSLCPEACCQSATVRIASFVPLHGFLWVAPRCCAQSARG